MEPLTESFAHSQPSRMLPELDESSPIQHLTLRARDLVDLWQKTKLPQLESVSVFIRTIDEAIAFARRAELSQLKSLSLAFRCGFSGSSPFDSFLGTVIEANEAAAEQFFLNANLPELQSLQVYGYSIGYWGREGLGHLGLQSLVNSDLLGQVKHLRLERLPLGDQGVQLLAPQLGVQLETLELVDVYCKGAGVRALCDSPCLRTLRQFDFSSNRCDQENMAALANVPMLNLESLNLSGPTINPYYWNVGVQPILDGGAAAWASSANVRQLRHLNLANCHLTDDGLRAIFGSAMEGLKTLDLSHNNFGAEAFRATADSSLWQTLEKLKLNHCRINDDAIESLTSVLTAPKLKTLELNYNSVGPRGAASLSNWSVTNQLWILGLHDNVIGDDGLISIAGSKNVSRILELDVEQDCWNSRTFNFNKDAALALRESSSLIRLDSLFSGCVDEYHGCGYGPGFSMHGIQSLIQADWMRPALTASLQDWTGIGDYMESAAFDEEAELTDKDFRQAPYELNEREYDEGAQKMKQLATPRDVDLAYDELEEPATCELPENDAEGGGEAAMLALQGRVPIPVVNHRLKLTLSLKDSERPLSVLAGKVIAETLRSIFHAEGVGDFSSSGASSIITESGEMVETSECFYVGLQNEPELSLRRLRETLWWIGAPADTELNDFPIKLSEPPAESGATFLQFTCPKLERWKPGCRIDRAPFSNRQRLSLIHI